MHSASILHRDIKPGNILIINNSRVAIGDFGLSRSISNYKQLSPSIKEAAKMREERKKAREVGIKHRLS
jgi:serine/threonine protein kinase